MTFSFPPHITPRIFFSVKTDKYSTNVEQYISLNNKTVRSKNSAYDAALLFRSLELWMNLHLARSRDCLYRTMCEGVSSIVAEGIRNDVVSKESSRAWIYADISR